MCSRGDRSSGCGGGNRSRPIPILMGYGWWPHLFPPETRVKQVGVNGLCFSFVSREVIRAVIKGRNLQHLLQLSSLDFMGDQRGKLMVAP